MFLPLFEASGHKEGFLSGQCDPRAAFDKEPMLKQAPEIHAINPNVMVKVPGTAGGYEVIEQLTAQAIATNNTLTFVLPQLMDCAKSVMRGLEKAKANGVDLSNWRSVITHMEARYGDLGGLRDAGKEIGIELTEGDVRLAELAIFKKAYRTINERGYQSKMLSCSLRVGRPSTASCVCGTLKRRPARPSSSPARRPSSTSASTSRTPRTSSSSRTSIDVDPPKDVMDKLLRIPYFARAYDEDGYTRDEYDTHPALVKTAEAFSKATQEMVDFAGSCLKGTCRAD